MLLKSEKLCSFKFSEGFSYAFSNSLPTVNLNSLFLEFLLDVGCFGLRIHFSHIFSIVHFLNDTLWEIHLSSNYSIKLKNTGRVCNF